MENKIKRIIVAGWGYQGGPNTIETDNNGAIESFTRNGELWYKKSTMEYNSKYVIAVETY